MRIVITTLCMALLAGSAWADDGDEAPPAVALHRVALAVDVAGPVHGWYDAGLTLRVSKNIAVSVEASEYGNGNPSPQAPNSIDAALALVVYPVRAFEGPFIEAGVVAIDRRGWDDGPTDIFKKGVRGLIGWQHTIDAGELGVTISAAIGDELVVDDTRSFPGSGLTGYARVGVAL